MRTRWTSILLLGVLGACGDPERPGSLVGTAGGATSGGGPGEAGASEHDDPLGGAAGSSEPAPDDGGSAGASESAVPAPWAVFPDRLEVDVACGVAAVSAEFVIQNRGSLPLVIASAKADSGYELGGAFPRTIAPRASEVVVVTPPAPKSGARIGETSDGTLSFVTNESGETTHQVALTSTLFGAKLQFTDRDGAPLGTTLTLSHLGAQSCPDTLKYRVRNAGNLSFTLLGPTFPSHFAGTTTGMTGVEVAPDAEIELQLAAVSGSGNVCSANGVLSFSGKGAFCDPIPSLNVSWAATATSPAAGCMCTAAAP